MEGVSVKEIPKMGNTEVVSAIDGPKTGAEIEKRLLDLEYKLNQVVMAGGNCGCGENAREAPSVVRIVNSITTIMDPKLVVRGGSAAINCIWAVLFCLGVAATAFFTYSTAVEYLAHPTATEVELNVSSSYDLPTIAICPTEWIDAEKAFALGLSSNALRYSLGYASRTFTTIEPEEIPKAKLEFLQFYTAQNFSSLFDYYNSIATDLATVYSWSEFEDLSTAIILNHRKSLFRNKMFLQYQVCHAYTLAPTRRSPSTTTMAAVKYVDKSKGICDRGPGLWIHVHLHHKRLFSPISPVYALASYRTKILVRSQRFRTLSKPGFGCRRNNTGYSASGCAAHCINKHYKNVIDCELYRYSTRKDALGPLDACNLFENLNNSDSTFADFETTDLHDTLLKHCFQKCPAKCDRTVYQLQIQWHQKMSSREYEVADSNVTSPQPANFRLYIEHAGKYDGETLSFMEVSTYSFTVLVNNVGGALGLFVGATLMTFVQAILFLVQRIMKKTGGYAVRKAKNSTRDMVTIKL